MGQIITFNNHLETENYVWNISHRHNVVVANYLEDKQLNINVESLIFIEKPINNQRENKLCKANNKV